MRILHVTTRLDPAGGGPPMVALGLAAAQAGLGHDVHLLSYATPSAADRIEAAVRNMPHACDINRHEMPPPSIVERVLGSSIGRMCRQLLPDIDFVHIHSVWVANSLAAARAARRSNAPYALTPHGMLDEWCMQQSAVKKRIALSLGFRAMLDRAAFLHVLTQDERHEVVRLRLSAPMEVIPNGIFTEELADLPPRGTFHAAHPELDGRPYILFLSRLHYKKGLDYLADAFAILARSDHQTQLVVAGPDDGARGSFERSVRSTSLADRVHLVGPQYSRDKWAALVGAACFCLPSRQEGFSIAITEALACGVPVVVSKQCHFPEVAEVGTGEVVELEPRAIAGALARIINDADLRVQMGRNGRELVRSRFTWPKIAQRTIDAYEKALHRARR